MRAPPSAALSSIAAESAVDLERLIAGAELQHPEEWPKGVAVN